MNTATQNNLTRQKFDAILTAYIEQEHDYIREHEQVKEILKPLEGKPINGRTLNEKRLNGLKYVQEYSMHYIKGKYTHLIGYVSSGYGHEDIISIEKNEATGHRGFEYLDACNGRAAQERINNVKAADHEKAYKVFKAIETNFNELRRLFAQVENDGFGSFDFPAYYNVLSSIYEPKNGDLKLTDFYFIRTNK